MIVRFGYVAIALDLHKGSPNKTITYTNYSKLPDDEIRLYKLKSLTEENLKTTKRILIHNNVRDIKVYRLTSSLIPLVNHPEVIKWDYQNEFSELFKELGKYILDNSLRISAHPDHFTILNSPRNEVLQSSLEDLKYHSKIFNSMDLDSKKGKLVLHVGGLYGSKKDSIERFIGNFEALPPTIRNRIILENDDKVYSAPDVLNICEEAKIPMVLDIHHHWCNNNGESIESLLEDIFNTWNNETFPPKIHVSSPKSDKNIRAHADYVDPVFFYEFLRKARVINRDFDVMIEAKLKDKALIKLMEDLKAYKEIKILDEATIEI